MHIAPAIYYCEVHLLYASLVCCAAWIITRLPFGSATLKYWIWVATVLNFMVPLGGFVDEFGATRISWARPLSVLGDAGVVASRSSAAAVLFCIWLAVSMGLALRLLIRLRREQRAGAAAPEAVPAGDLRTLGVPVEFAGHEHPPCVDGVLRSRISLPQGIDRILSRDELEAVLLHEATHARRRDNLIRLLYEVGRCALWFHPLVWVAGAKLALYRELSCDESVIRRSRGQQLISALAKLAEPARSAPVLQASAASFLSVRVALLNASRPRRRPFAVNFAVAVVFSLALLSGVYSTVAHTACCFVIRN
jgi:beta-lactamase regulating signal transducer with metallopeptidase domain